MNFLESGKRLMDKLTKLIRACEVSMLKKAKSASFNGDKNNLRKASGFIFVGTVSGRDRQLEATEKVNGNGTAVPIVLYSTEIYGVIKPQQCLQT
jgi:hypothetical protein